jgi:periplasmic divalent cation tolerance protein
MEGFAFHFRIEENGGVKRRHSLLLVIAIKLIMSSSEPTLIVVMTTLPDVSQANSIAKILVEEKLAACVQVMPSMTSTYMWQGELCQESEHLVLIKTLQANYEALLSRMRSLHPYETPEIIAIPTIAVDQDYLNWVITQP